MTTNNITNLSDAKFQEIYSLANAEILRAKAEKVTNLQKGCLVFVGMGMSYEARFEGDICNHRIRTTFKNNEGHTYFVEFCKNGRKDDKLNDFVCVFSIDEDWRKAQETEAIRLLDVRNAFERYSPKWNEAHEAYKANDHQRYYNAFGIQHSRLELRFSAANVLQLINETFGSSYTSLAVDEYTLTTDDFTCFC